MRKRGKWNGGRHSQRNGARKGATPPKRRCLGCVISAVSWRSQARHFEMLVVALTNRHPDGASTVVKYLHASNPHCTVTLIGVLVKSFRKPIRPNRTLKGLDHGSRKTTVVRCATDSRLTSTTIWARSMSLSPQKIELATYEENLGEV